MDNHTEVHRALREHLLSLSVCTASGVLLSATTAGYTRASGSFVADGFTAGMEVTASGFSVNANNQTVLILGVTPTTLTVRGGCIAETAASDRQLRVGLPALRAWENKHFQPVVGRPYVEEDFVPGSATQRGMTRGGVVEDTGLYVIRWYGLANAGERAVSKGIDAVLNRFPPGTALIAVPKPEDETPDPTDFTLDVAPDDDDEPLLLLGDTPPFMLEPQTDGVDFALVVHPDVPGYAVVVRIRGDVAPIRSQLRNDTPGWGVVSVSLPFRVFTLNPS